MAAKIHPADFTVLDPKTKLQIHEPPIFFQVCDKIAKLFDSSKPFTISDYQFTLYPFHRIDVLLEDLSEKSLKFRPSVLWSLASKKVFPSPSEIVSMFNDLLEKTNNRSFTQVSCYAKVSSLDSKRHCTIKECEVLVQGNSLTRLELEAAFFGRDSKAMSDAKDQVESAHSRWVATRRTPSTTATSTTTSALSKK